MIRNLFDRWGRKRQPGAESRSLSANQSKWLRIATVIALLSALALCATVPLEWKNQAILGLVLFGGAFFLNRRSSAHQTTIALMAISIFVTARYLWWRFTETGSYLITNWSSIPTADLFFTLLLIGAEGYASLILVLGYFQNARPLERRPVALPDDTDEWPSVDVFIPTYNEPIDVIRTTMLAARNLDWPPDRLNIYVLDDGRRGEIHELAEQCGVHYIARLDNEGAKAGNINFALLKTYGEFVAIFDSDHIPTRSFLQSTMGCFLQDSRLALVQTPHHFYSPDPFERNLGTFRRVPNESELFYGVLQSGNDFWNASFFCGSCAVLRRRAIEKIGGIATETVTEDSHSSLRLQKLGWNTAYINIPQAAGLATANLADHITQRIRWARGMVQVLRLEHPLFASGLKLPQRLCYFNAVLHFLHAGPRLIFLTAPLVYLLLGRSNLYGYVWAILAYVVPHLMLATLTNSRVHGGHRHSFWNEVFETILAPYILIPTLLALINPRWGKFNVTPKRTVVTQSYFDLRIAAPFILLLLLNIAGLVAAGFQLRAGVDSQGTLIVNIFWTAVNVLVLGAALAVPWEIRQLRSSVRVPVRLNLRIALPDGTETDGVALDMSVGGAAIQLSRSCALRPGDRTSLIFALDGSEFSLPAVVQRTNGLRFGLSFPQTGIAGQELITRLVFGRADAWMLWTEGRQKDKPLRSLGRIVLISLKGILSIPKGLVSLPGDEKDELPALPKPIAKRAPALPFLGILLAAFLVFAAHAEAGEPFSDVRDLPALGQRQAITFRGREGRLNLHFGVPVTKVVKDAWLALHFRSSGGFMPESSRITVLLNGSAVASIPVPNQEITGDLARQVQLELPPDLVVSDNLLSFQFSGNCSAGCREAFHWVRIETSTSVRLSGTMLALANDLRLLPAPYFDPSVHRPLRVPVVFSESPDATMLEAAGVVSSWFGVLADDRGVQLPVRIGAPDTGDAVLITRNHSAISSALKLAAKGPTLALRDNPADTYGKLLVVSGDTSNEILAAARSLVLGQYQKQGDTASVGGNALPPVSAPYDSKRWLNPDKPAGLGDALGPDQLRVYGSGSVNLYFRLPPDLSFGQRSTVPLRLMFRTSGSTVDEKGELRVRLNDLPVATVRVNVSDLATLQRETISLPVAALYPANTISLDFVFPPSKSGATDRFPEAVVLPTSTLELAGIPRFIELPRLDLFMKSGFPFTRLADLSQTAVVLPEKPTEDELSTYLNLLGRFGAQTGYPSLRVTVTSPSLTQMLAGKDILLIGTSEDQPLISQWTGGMSVFLDHGRLRQTEANGLFGFLVRMPLLAVSKEWRRLGDIVAADSKSEGLIHGFTSPMNPHRSVVLVTANDGFQAMLAALAGDNLGDVSGSVSLLENGRFQSFSTGRDSNYIGELSWRESFNNWIAARFWLIAIFAVCSSLILARWFHTWSEEHARIRLRGEQ